MIDIPSVIRARDAARMLGLSESTLAKLRLSGNGPAYCKLGRRVLYRPQDLSLWLEEHRRRSTSDIGTAQREAA
jgi:hypothetical protein